MSFDIEEMKRRLKNNTQPIETEEEIPVKKKAPKEKKERYFEIVNFKPSLEVYEIPYDPSEDEVGGEWIADITLVQDGKTVDIFSIRPPRTFSSPEEAISEGNGIIEMLGFFCTKVIDISVYYWDPKNDEYRETSRYFDGNDFYKEPPEDV